MKLQRLGVWETVSYKQPRIFVAEMRAITRTINVHVCSMQETDGFFPPRPSIFTATFPPPRIGEVEPEGTAASTRDVIKDPAYHASQDAAGNAASLAEDGARDDVHVVHSAQGKLSFPFIGLCHAYIMGRGLNGTKATNALLGSMEHIRGQLGFYKLFIFSPKKKTFLPPTRPFSIEPVNHWTSIHASVAQPTICNFVR